MATDTWSQNQDGSWNDAADWSLGAIPTSIDDVVIDTPDPHTVTFSSGTSTVADLSIGNDLLLITGGELTVEQTALIVGSISQESGTLAFDGPASVEGSFYLTNGDLEIGTSGSLELSGTVQFGPGGTGEVDGPGTLSTTGTVAIDEGVYVGAGLNWINSGTVLDASNIAGGDPNGSTATLTNETGATFDFTADGAIYNNSNAGGTLTFINDGTLSDTAGGGTSQVEVDIVSTGVIAAESGVLQFDDGGTFANIIDGAGIVNFAGGVNTVTGTLVATNVFDQTGGSMAISQGATLDLAGTTSLASLYFGSYADFDGPGTLLTPGTLSIDEGTYLGAGLNWINSGTVLDASNIAGGDANGSTATLTNESGATFDFTADGVIYNNSNASGTLTFINDGTLIDSAGGGTSQVEVDIVSTGVIAAESGVLQFDDGGTFANIIDGAGIVNFAGGVNTVTGTLVATNVFDQTGGSMAISQGAALDLAGATTLSGGFGSYADFDGPGTLLTPGTLTLDEYMYLGAGLTWTNTGTIQEASNLFGGDANGSTATLTNEAGATFDFTGVGGIYNNSSASGTLTFINDGTLSDTAGGGTSQVEVDTVSTGVIADDAGALQFDDGGTFTNTIDGAGIVNFAGGVNTVTGTLVATNVFDQTGGSMAISQGAALDLAGATTLSGGFGSYADFDGPGTLLTPGTLTLDEYMYLGAGLTWTNTGTIQEASNLFGGDANGSTATLTNEAGATFDFTGVGGIYNNSSASGTLTFINDGTLSDTAGGGTSQVEIDIVSTGVIAAESGVLQFDDGGTFTNVIDGTGVINFAGGVNTVTGTLVATNVFDQTGGSMAISQGATLDLAGATTLSGGYGSAADFDGPGTLLTPGTLSIDEYAYLGAGLTWTNTGTILEASSLFGGDANGSTATLTNEAGATFDFTADGGIYNNSSASGTLTFINDGTLNKTAGTGTSSVDTTLDNAASGTIVADSGVLYLEGAVDNSGVIEGGVSAEVIVAGTLTGTGNVVVDGGGKVEIGSATGNSVVLTGAGTIQLDDPSAYAGTIYGLVPGAEIALGGAQVSSISLRGSLLDVSLASGGSYDLSISGLQSTDDLSLSGNVLTGTPELGEPTPDLVVSTISAPAKALAGEPITVSWTDTNHGDVAASGPWTDEIVLVSDAAGDNPQLLGTLTVDGTLTGGQILNQSLAVTLPAATSGDYYFLVKTDALDQVPGDGTGPDREDVTGPVDIIPTAVYAPAPSISSFTPASGSDLGDVTVTVDGANFNADDRVTLVGPGGTTVTAGQVRYVSSGELWATFDLSAAGSGAYQVGVSGAAGAATSSGSFEVDTDAVGQLLVNLVLPATISEGQSGTATVNWTNTGSTDVAAPLLEVDSTQALLEETGATTGSSSLLFLATGSIGPSGILAPGASGSFSFQVVPTNPTPEGDVSVNLGVVGSTGTITTDETVGGGGPLTPLSSGDEASSLASTGPVSSTIDWGSIESSLQPPTVDATDWNNVFAQFVALVGTTTESLDTALAASATELAQVGQRTSDVPTLLQYELFQASGAMAGATVDATDISASSSSLSLSLDRTYDGTLLDRDATGAFGDGWSSAYDVTAVPDSTGDVYIQSATALHVFTLQADGTYAAGSGDPSTLTVAGGLYSMNDGSGDIETFNAAGKLASITDSNGNITEFAYGSNGVLQMAKNLTTGETITFTSDAAGRITSAVGSDGQTVTYTYDPTDTLLLSASSSAGTTTYTYAPATGSAQDNALASITGPGGVQENFSYDAAGRLASQSGSSGTETYSYGSAGSVTVTDGDGDKTTLLYGSNGAVAQVQDALGNVTQLQSNAAGDLTSATTQGGSAYQYGYDTSGNLTSYTDPLGGIVTATYALGTSNLTDFTAQRGEQTHYTYNAAGDVTGINYEDGSGDSYQYNTQGLLTSSTDADGNTTLYGYDSAGDLTSKQFSDGTSDTYTYDSRGDLTSATASGEGTTVYTYNAADQLTSVTNPQDQVESYTYNTVGEVATRTEPDGSVTQYIYDSSGRLTELQDGSGNVIDKYTYNAAGELTRTLTGSGASTTYQYDTDGNATEILNLNADGSVGSRYDYTYNMGGQVIEEATSDGVWTYGYDASGELTQAAFQSINASVASQSISYSYDAAGNRTTETLNGVVTNYTTNMLNQYTEVGWANYTYDADGNVITETNSTGTTRFTYNQDQQLIMDDGPDGNFSYNYDALGDLVSSTDNGIVEYYVDDPLTVSTSGQPLAAVAESYDASGAPIDDYVYGNGLAAELSATNGVSYALPDTSGNVVGLVGPDGVQSSSYYYLPYGGSIDPDNNVAANVGFSGEVGVLTTGNGLLISGSRSYDPTLGRFLEEDPSGLDGGPNLYEYGSNDPLAYFDPNGQRAKPADASDKLSDFPNKVDEYQGKALQPISNQASSVIDQAGALGDQLQQTGTAQVPAANQLDPSGSLSDLIANGNPEMLQSSRAQAGIVNLFGLEWPKDAKTLQEDYDRIKAGISGLIFINKQIQEIDTKAVSKRPTSQIKFDPHLLTFDGLRYDFQTVGEFVLVQQKSLSGFQVQARISVPSGASTYSIITELGISVGADRVTIDSTRSSPVWINGVSATFVDGEVDLADGVVTQTSSGYVVTLDSGESVTADILSYGTQAGPSTTSFGINTTIALNPFVETPGSVEGLLGNDNGDPSKDLTLADGTVLPTNLPTSELYGAYADSWRVTQATSLLDYGPGQTTATFTDTSYPGTPLSVSSFPEAAIQMATAVVEQMGITDPGLQQDAIYDYLVTGNTALLTTEANLQQEGVTTALSADPTMPTPPPEVGVISAEMSEAEAASGATTAQFMVYRSGDTRAAATVSYAVVAPDGTYVGAGSFGGTLPSGTIAFAAGQTSVDLPITLTSGIGDVASSTLEVQLSAASPNVVIGQTAQVQIVNDAPVAGTAPVFSAELVSDQGLTPVQSGDTWTFDLGTAGSAAVTLAVENLAAAGSDLLSGTITASGDGGLTGTILSQFSDLSPTAILDIATLSHVSTHPDGGTETLTIALEDVNSSGYAAALPTETIILTDDAVPCYCRGTLILTALGEVAVEDLSEGDGLVTGSGETRALRWIGTRSYSGRFANGNREILPVLIRQDAIADGVPRRDLCVSPLHAMFLDGALIPAAALVNGRSIRQLESVEQVEYFHLELDTHDVIVAEGALSESFVDDGSRGMFHNAAEYWALHPDEIRQPAIYCAPRLEDGEVVEAIRRRLMARAEAHDQAAASGRFDGWLDVVTPDRIAGWARDDASDEPVSLRILDNGVTIGRVVADRHRPDLEHAGYGHGRYGFELIVPGGLCPSRSHVIEARWEADGRELGRSPWRIEPQPLTLTASDGTGRNLRGYLDETTRDRVRGWALDESEPDAPVALQVLDNGRLIARTLANVRRPDLAQAGIGSGRYGFDVVIPGGLSPLARHVIQVRCDAHGTELVGSPFVLEAADCFDADLEQTVTRAVASLGRQDDRERVLAFMLSQVERLKQQVADAEIGRARRQENARQRRRLGPSGSKAASGGERRALVVDTRLPVAGRDAGSSALLSHMQALRRLGYAVSLAVSDVSSMTEDAVRDLTGQGITVCRPPVYSSVEEVLRRQAESIDVVYLHRVSTAGRYLNLVRQHLPRARVLYSVADLHHVRLERQALAEDRPELRMLSRRTRQEELTAALLSDAVLTHSEEEAALLRQVVPPARVHRVPWDVPVQAKVAAFAERHGIAFIANYGHAPNRDAAHWLIDEVMPLVWETHRHITCLLVGSEMPAGVRGLSRPGVTILGHVPDLHETVLNRVRLTVAPLRFGAGVKGKVLDSFAAGVPCVMSKVAAEGIALGESLRSLVTCNAQDMASAICTLHEEEGLHQSVSRAGRHLLKVQNSKKAVTNALFAAIEGAPLSQIDPGTIPASATRNLSERISRRA